MSLSNLGIYEPHTVQENGKFGFRVCVLAVAFVVVDLPDVFARSALSISTVEILFSSFGLCLHVGIDGIGAIYRYFL